MEAKIISVRGKRTCVKALVAVLLLLLIPLLGKASATCECDDFYPACYGQCDYCVPYDPDSSYLIQGCIGQAEEGSTICVAPGTHHEDILIGKRITLRSCNAQGNQDPQNTTILGRWGPVVKFAGVGAVVEGFTITMSESDADPGGAGGCSEMGPCYPWGEGTGIYISGSAIATINNCIIRGNGGRYVGGILCDACSSLTVMNSTIRYNNGYCSGGVATIGNGSITLINSVIKNNYGCLCGGLMSEPDSSLELINSTVRENKGVTFIGSGGILLGYPSSLSMVNSIVWGNSTLNTPFYGVAPQQMELFDDYYEDYSFIHITNSNVQTTNLTDYRILASQGSTNINSDPEFIDGFHLDRSSRSIDVGNNAAPDLPAQDKDGDQRIIDGNLLSSRSCDDEAVVDMGADEVGACDPNLLVANFELDPLAGTIKVNPFIRTQVLEPLTVQFTDTSTGNVSSWHWDFGDGTTSTEQNPSHSYYGLVDEDSHIRDYTVTLEVSDGVNSDTRTVQYAVHTIDLPQLIQIEPEGSVHRGQEIRIIGWDFDDNEGSLGENIYRPEDPAVRTVNIGDITYNLGDPAIISWSDCLIIVKVPNYPESDFGGSDSIIKDVSVTVNKYYTSNNAPVPLQIVRVFCGDDLCSDTETCSSCQQDCGKCVNVIEPSGGDALQGGSVFTITLEINKLPGAATKEKLHYKCSEDAAWVLIKTLTCSSGLCPLTYPWQVPEVGSMKTGCKVRARILDSSGSILASDQSDGYFTISP